MPAELGELSWTERLQVLASRVTLIWYTARMGVLDVFCRDCDKLERAIAERDNEDAIFDVAAPLRRLLLDQTVHAVMRACGERIDLVFKVSPMPSLPPGFRLGTPTFECISDGLPADKCLPALKPCELSLEKFLRHVIMRANGREYTARDVIKFLANKEGSVHWDPNLDPEQEILRKLNSTIRLFGVPMVTYCVRGVAKVVLHALHPPRERSIVPRLGADAGAGLYQSEFQLACGIFTKAANAGDWATCRVLYPRFVRLCIETKVEVPKWIDVVLLTGQVCAWLDREANLDDLVWVLDIYEAGAHAVSLNPEDRARTIAAIASPLCHRLAVADRLEQAEVIAARLFEYRQHDGEEAEWPVWLSGASGAVFEASVRANKIESAKRAFNWLEQVRAAAPDSPAVKQTWAAIQKQADSFLPRG